MGLEHLAVEVEAKCMCWYPGTLLEDGEPGPATGGTVRDRERLLSMSLLPARL